MRKKADRLNNASIRWYKPLIQALRDLGGSATRANTLKKIIQNEHLTTAEVSETRGKTGVSKFENDVSYARFHLVSGGYIDNSVRGVWTLTDAGKTVDMTDELATEICRNAASDNTAPINALGDADVNPKHVWLYAPGEGASMWETFYTEGIMALGWPMIGDLSCFKSMKEIEVELQEKYDPDASFRHAKRMLWDFFQSMKPGDIVFARKGRSEIIGKGIVVSDYEYDDNEEAYPNVRKVKWTHKGSWTAPITSAMITLVDLTDKTETIKKISALFEIENDTLDDEEDIATYPIYSRENFLTDVYMDENTYRNLVGLLQAKKNIILTGAPGVGKTFIAKRLAYSMMGMKDIERVMMVQFHQSYSYEDFIMGIRPSDTGFSVKEGVFYSFCKKAADDSDNDYFFIIDEINRGNISKIFGELFMLIENDKRGDRNKIQLLYADELFYIPANVYIIGMMNTSDRSLAMLDYALRRRFGFFALSPAFSSERFKSYQKSLNSTKFDHLISCVEDLNQSIKDDESLGEGFCIGHSYFCNIEPEELTDQKLTMLVEYEIIPLLKEYWFDEPAKANEWGSKLRSTIQ